MTKLGVLPDESATRDAIHIAVVPMIAATPLAPGQKFRLTENREATCVWFMDGETVGVVDPFLKADVQRGERFYALVPQERITPIRHDWESHDFPAESTRALAKALTEERAEREDPDDGERDGLCPGCSG